VANRIQTPDLLKGFAVIFMIQVHLMELFARQEIFDGFAGKISLFLGGVPAAPVFMVIMGYFLAFGHKEPQAMMKRGLKLFLAGIVLNIGLNAHLIYKILFDGWQLNAWHYIFGVDILHLAGLSLIVIGAFNYLFKRNFIPYIAAAIAVVLISSFVPVYSTENSFGTYIMAFVHSNSEWSYFPMVPWIAYPLAGYSFKLFEGKYLGEGLDNSIKVSLTVALSVLFFFTFDYAKDISHKLDAYYHHGFVFFMWSLPFVLFWALILSFIEKAAGGSPVLKYIKWLGVHVTSVYVVQWLIIGNIATAIFKTQSPTELVFWFIGITITTSLIVYFLKRIKPVYNLIFLVF